MSRFGFRMQVEATVTVEGSDARAARDALGGQLDGATARVVARAGAAAGLELVDIRLSPDVALILIDGMDPIEPLRTALSKWHARGGDE